MLAWSVATGLLTVAVWVGVNPFLWPDPVGRTVSMLTQQQSIMVEQGAMFGNPVDAPLPARIGLAAYRTFVENSTPSFDYGGEPGGEPTTLRSFTGLPKVGPLSLELLLAAIGFVVLVRLLQEFPFTFADAGWAWLVRLGLVVVLASGARSIEDVVWAPV